MMQFFTYILTILIFTSSVFAQEKLNETLEVLNTKSVPYMQVSELMAVENVTILDTRKKEEFDISHIKNAIWVGYEAYTQDAVETKIVDKSTPILVYCSIGVRSEDIGEKLQTAGYTNVKNLYGGIFEWKNQGHEVYNNNIATDSVHTYDAEWGKFLSKGIKVYTSNKTN